MLAAFSSIFKVVTFTSVSNAQNNLHQPTYLLTISLTLIEQPNFSYYLPVSKARRELANLDERKIHAASSIGLGFSESDAQAKTLGRDIILYAVRKHIG